MHPTFLIDRGPEEPESPVQSMLLVSGLPEKKKMRRSHLSHSSCVAPTCWRFSLVPMADATKNGKRKSADALKLLWSICTLWWISFQSLQSHSITIYKREMEGFFLLDAVEEEAVEVPEDEVQEEDALAGDSEPSDGVDLGPLRPTDDDYVEEEDSSYQQEPLPPEGEGPQQAGIGAVTSAVIIAPQRRSRRQQRKKLAPPANPEPSVAAMTAAMPPKKERRGRGRRKKQVAVANSNAHAFFAKQWSFAPPNNNALP